MAQIVPPSVCFYPSAVVIEGIELLDVELNSTLKYPPSSPRARCAFS